jgi:hypothetical protein
MMQKILANVTSMRELIVSSEMLLNEAQELIARSRAQLATTPADSQVRVEKQTTKRGTTMSNATPEAAAKLYAEGKPVVEVAQELGITYGKARKLISESGTSVRDASARLKGRTRRKA